MDLWEKLEDKYYEAGIAAGFLRFILLGVVAAAGFVSGVVSFAAGMAVSHAPLADASLGPMIFRICEIVVVVIGLRILVSPEDNGVREWGILIGAAGLATMGPGAFRLSGSGLGEAAAWACFLILMGMAGSGLWVLSAWTMKRWAREMHALKTENEVRRTGWDQPPPDR